MRDQDAIERARHILKYIASRRGKSTERDSVSIASREAAPQKVSELRFVPSTEGQLFEARQLFSSDLEPIVGAVHPVAEETFDFLKYKDVHKHLSFVTDQLQRLAYNSGNDNIYHVCRWLQDSTPKQLQKVLNPLRNVPWVEAEFGHSRLGSLLPENVALLDKEFIFSSPEFQLGRLSTRWRDEFKHEFLKAAGISTAFSDTQLLAVLRSLKDGNPTGRLRDTHLSIALKSLRVLGDRAQKSTSDTFRDGTPHSECLVLSTDRQLVRAGDVIMDDISTMSADLNGHSILLPPLQIFGKAFGCISASVKLRSSCRESVFPVSLEAVQLAYAAYENKDPEADPKAVFLNLWRALEGHRSTEGQACLGRRDDIWMRIDGSVHSKSRLLDEGSEPASSVSLSRLNGPALILATSREMHVDELPLSDLFFFSDRPWVLIGPSLLIFDNPLEASCHAGASFSRQKLQKELPEELNRFENDIGALRTIFRLPLRSDQIAKELLGRFINSHAEELLVLSQTVRMASFMTPRRASSMKVESESHIRREQAKIESVAKWHSSRIQVGLVS